MRPQVQPGNEETHIKSTYLVGIKNSGFLLADELQLKLDQRNRGSGASGCFFGFEITREGRALGLRPQVEPGNEEGV